MTAIDQNLLDPSRWISTSVLLGWGSDMKKLQDLITGRTFAPHWKEFEANWLASGSANPQDIPDFDTLTSRCKEEWDSNRNDFYLMRPDVSEWHKNQGMGHFIRLLTMTVRENMASNGIWTTAQGEQLQKYFQNAYIIANSMKEEWIQKGKLYEYFRTTGKQESVPHHSAEGQNGVTSSLGGNAILGPSNGNTGLALCRPAALRGSDLQLPSPDSLLGTNRTPSSKKGSSASRSTIQTQVEEAPLSIKKEALADKENNFLESLDAELTQKGLKGEKNLPGLSSAHPTAGPALPRKRTSLNDNSMDAKRRKSDAPNGKDAYDSPTMRNPSQFDANESTKASGGHQNGHTR